MAATSAPLYIWCVVRWIGLMTGNTSWSGSGTLSSSSFVTMAFCSMSTPFIPLILTMATVSGASSWVCSGTGLIGM